LWPEPAGWKEENWASFELEAVLHAADGQTDTYVSQNRFRGKRRAVVNVLELCSMYSDLDYYKAPELRDLSPEAVLEKVLERLRDEGIPGPSLALSSGRGLQAVWAHKPVGRKEMPTWNAAQDRIYRVLGPMRAVDLSGSGLSRAHVDAARESIKGNARRAASTVAQRFWELSGGVARCGVCGNAMSPHTTSRAGGRKAPYYRCFQRYNSGPRDCTNTKTLPAAPLEEAVWQKVRLLLEEPERVMAAYDAYVELRGRRLGGDPDREARGLSARLEKLERRRSNLIDMGADGTIGREDLRAKLAEADEERDSLRRALRRAAGRGEELKRLRRERGVLNGRFSAMRGMGLRHLPPQDRRAVYDALRLMAHTDGNGDVSITGIFDADLTELLPTSWALAKAGAREYDPSLNRRLPTPHKGVVSAEHPRPGT